MRKTILILLVMVVVLGIVYYAVSQNSDTAANNQTPYPDISAMNSGQPPAKNVPADISNNATPENNQLPTSAATNIAPATSTIREFNITGKNFEFSVKEIKVKKGDTVRINFTSGNGFHDWVIDEFNAKTTQLQSGQSETVEFTVDTTGEFEYYCSVGEHRALGMVGKLIVE